MFNTEKRMLNWLRAKLPGHWVSVETYVTQGYPDVNYATSVDSISFEGWMELKVVGSLACRANFRKEQFAWITSRFKAGGRVHVVIGTRDGYIKVVPVRGLRDLLKGEIAGEVAGKVFKTKDKHFEVKLLRYLRDN